MSKPTLYLIQGFIGAGKTTFSKKLSLESGAIHLNPDEAVTKLYSKDEYMQNWDECFENTVHALWEKTKEYLNKGNDVIFDMGFWYRKDRDFARQIARECNANCLLYYLYVPDNILKERIVADRPPEWAERHLQNFDKSKSRFEVPKPDEDAITINHF